MIQRASPIRRAVFLDRDGVINRPTIRQGKPYPPERLDDFVLLPGVVEGCSQLRGRGYLLVVVTNQPDVGRGTQTREQVEKMHAYMQSLLPIDRIEVCYDAGGGLTSAFRKPAPGLLFAAADQLAIDLLGSWMIGDRWRDIDCGAAAGCRTIFIDHHYQESLQAKPTYVVSNFQAAVETILSTLTPYIR